MHLILQFGRTVNLFKCRKKSNEDYLIWKNDVLYYKEKKIGEVYETYNGWVAQDKWKFTTTCQSKQRAIEILMFKTTLYINYDLDYAFTIIGL